jgi:hypothetical protein
MSDNKNNPYEPVAFRGNPTRIRGLLQGIKLVSKRINDRDGDVLERVLQEYLEWYRGLRIRPGENEKGPK